jgi:hypothetical protein
MTSLKTFKIAVPIIAVTTVLLTLTTLAALNASRDIDFNGSITTVNVEVYYDAACTQTCSTINVGTLSPGSTFPQTVYVKNTGTVPLTLSLTTNDWNPTAASTYLTLSWNRQNHVLNAGASCEATLTLSAAKNTGSLTTFGFSATITGTQ